MSPLVRVVSVLLCGSARLCFTLGCIRRREGLAMTLLGVSNDGGRLLCVAVVI